MKRILLLSLCLVSCAATTEIEDDAIIISPSERRAIIKKFMNMQQEIDTLEKKLKTLEEKTGCA